MNTLGKITMRVSIVISLLLVLVGAITSYFIVTWDVASLPVSSKATTLVSLWACVSAFISAAFVIRSYLQTNRAFVLSQKPHLRIWVQNGNARTSQQDATPVHMTIVHYENMTLNPFQDLTIHVKVGNSKVSADLSELFSPKMFMSGRDQRQRSFPTKKQCLARGLDIEAEFPSDDPLKLSISYEFTFANKLEKVTIQMYFWDRGRKQWQLE